jgi:hypothetical protein
MALYDAVTQASVTPAGVGPKPLAPDKKTPASGLALSFADHATIRARGLFGRSHHIEARLVLRHSMVTVGTAEGAEIVNLIMFLPQPHSAKSF